MHNYNLRSDDKFLLSAPKFKTFPILGDRAFTTAAPKLCNALTYDARSTSNFSIFKKKLKTILSNFN